MIDLIAFTTIVLAVGLYFRVNAVSRLRIEIIDKVSLAAKKDISLNPFGEWMWRYKVFDSISFDEMVLKIWKPTNIKAFYSDTKFLEIAEELPNEDSQ